MKLNVRPKKGTFNKSFSAFIISRSVVLHWLCLCLISTTGIGEQAFPAIINKAGLQAADLFKGSQIFLFTLFFSFILIVNTLGVQIKKICLDFSYFMSTGLFSRLVRKLFCPCDWGCVWPITYVKTNKFAIVFSFYLII